MAAAIESVLTKLLNNSSNEGQAEGFKEIQALFKDPNIIRELCLCISQSADPGVRRYAALLARRRILKSKHWKKIPPDVKQGLKNLVLETYIKDTEKTVRNALAELIGAIAKHDLSDGRWPELMNILNQSLRSSNVVDKEIALYTLSVIAKALGPKLKPHCKGLLSIFQKTLTDTSSIDIPYYTIRSLTFMVCSIGSEELTLFQSLVPNVIVIIKLLANDDQDKACKCLEIFDELVESEVSVLAPHLKSLVEFGLEISSSDKYDTELRIKAVNMISYLIRMKKKAVMKQRLVQPILEVFFPLMCNPCPGDSDEGVDDDEIEQSLPSAAGQALDIMALHLPPAKLLPLLMHILPPAFENPNAYHRKAGYLALSVIAEGCSEFIRHKYLPIFIPVIIRGIKDSEAIVRNAALYAVGQYAEYLQPEISKYAAELLPVLFEYLHQVCLMLQGGHKDPPSLSRTFYALERFCENLEDIETFLPTLMDCLITFLTINTEKSLVKELAVEAIGSVAAASKVSFVPYFSRVMDHLQLFISSPQTDATRPLQVTSIDALAIIARTVGPETFMPLAHECVKCGLHLMQENDDPDVRRACYGLLSSLSVVLKTDMVPYLNVIAERLLESIKSTEGISLNTNGVDTNTAFTLFEDEDENENDSMNSEQFENLGETENEEDEDDDITGFNVENAYIEEKEGAVLALRDLCEEVGVHFLPYMEVSFAEVSKLADHLSDDVRKSAIGTLAQFCITLNNVHTETPNLEYLQALKTNLEFLIPKMFSLVREDAEHGVVLGCLEALQVLIDKVKDKVTHDGFLEPLCMLIRDVFQNKLACQDAESNEDDEDDQEAEYDNLLLEYAGDLIASLVKVVPWQKFAPYLAGLLPFLINKSKKACTISEKSFSIGTLAEIISSMEAGSVKPFLPHLQPVFLSGMKEDNEEVRSNSVYGLGVLVENAGELIFDQYPLYLQALSNMIATEEDPRAKDNICGTVARLIKTNCKDVPLNTVFPVFLQYLPLKEDLEESLTVFECFSFLQGIRCEQFFQSIPQVLKICSEAIASGKLQDDAMAVVSKLLHDIYNEFPSDFETLIKSLPPANAEAIMKAKSVA